MSPHGSPVPCTRVKHPSTLRPCGAGTPRPGVRFSHKAAVPGLPFPGVPGGTHGPNNNPPIVIDHNGGGKPPPKPGTDKSPPRPKPEPDSQPKPEPKKT